MDKWEPSQGTREPKSGGTGGPLLWEPLLLANLPPGPGGEQDLEGPHCSERPQP